MTIEREIQRITYVDLVIAKNKVGTFVYRAPFCSNIKKGDTVEVNGFNLEVVDVFETFEDTDLYKFAKTFSGDLQRVTGKVERFDYSDEDYIRGIE